MGYLITNVDASLLTAEQIASIYSTLWQVELMSKPFKSIGNLNETRRYKAENVLCEVYAKLITQVLRHWDYVGVRLAIYSTGYHQNSRTYRTTRTNAYYEFQQIKTALLKTLRNIKRDLQYSDQGKHRAGKHITYKLL